MGQLRQDTVDRTITLQLGQLRTQKRTITSQHSRLDGYMGQSYLDTVDGTDMLGHSSQDSQLHYDAVDLIITLGHSSQDNYVRTQQMGQLHQDTVGCIVRLDRIYMAIKNQMGQLHYNTVDGDLVRTQ